MLGQIDQYNDQSRTFFFNFLLVIEKTWEMVFERIKNYFSYNNRKVVEALVDANTKIVGRYVYSIVKSY